MSFVLSFSIPSLSLKDQINNIISILKIILSIYFFHMRNRYKFYKQSKHNISSLPHSFLQEHPIHSYNPLNEQTAKQALMSIPDDHQSYKINLYDLREVNNGSDITRWNQREKIKGVNKENQIRIKIQSKCIHRHIVSQNALVQSHNNPFGIGYHLKKELNKLQLPLKEKNLNSQQFKLPSREKDRCKTRNQLKLDIINSKLELAPSQLRKRTQPQVNCQKIIKLRTENSQYHKIKRKGLFTIDLEQQKSLEQTSIRNLSQTRQRLFFLRNQSENYSKTQQSSASFLFTGEIFQVNR